MNLLDELLRTARALDLASVEHALIGGLAVAVWGAPRATKDIDLLVRREDLDRAVQVAISRDALIQMKAVAGRPQDIADIERLRGIDRWGT
jgi:hypothetical protein